MISRRQAARALELHADDLSSYPNVVGVGLRDVASERAVESEPDHALAVYVSRKVPQHELSPSALLPGYVEIPARSGTHKVAVRVIDIGEPELQRGSERAHDTFSAE